MKPGYACDNDAGLYFEDNEVKRVVSARAGAKCYHVSVSGGQVRTHPLAGLAGPGGGPCPRSTGQANRVWRGRAGAGAGGHARHSRRPAGEPPGGGGTARAHGRRRFRGHARGRLDRRRGGRGLRLHPVLPRRSHPADAARAGAHPLGGGHRGSAVLPARAGAERRQRQRPRGVGGGGDRHGLDHRRSRHRCRGHPLVSGGQGRQRSVLLTQCRRLPLALPRRRGVIHGARQRGPLHLSHRLPSRHACRGHRRWPQRSRCEPRHRPRRQHHCDAGLSARQRVRLGAVVLRFVER
jgi:hypothetical protein